MIISELISALESIRAERGDLPVYMFDNYVADEGWGDMPVWCDEGVSVDYYKEPITLDGSGDEREFIGVR